MKFYKYLMVLFLVIFSTTFVSGSSFASTCKTKACPTSVLSEDVLRVQRSLENEDLEGFKAELKVIENSIGDYDTVKGEDAKFLINLFYIVGSMASAESFDEIDQMTKTNLIDLINNKLVGWGTFDVRGITGFGNFEP